MVKKLYIFHALLLVWVWLTATAASAGEPLVAKPSTPTVTVQLPANPATGYQWVLNRYDPRLLELPTSQYVPPANNVPGAPGHSVWQFTVKQAAFATEHNTTVILEYKRPWEKTAGQRQVIEINIQTR